MEPLTRSALNRGYWSCAWNATGDTLRTILILRLTTDLLFSSCNDVLVHETHLCVSNSFVKRVSIGSCYCYGFGVMTKVMKVDS